MDGMEGMALPIVLIIAVFMFLPMFAETNGDKARRELDAAVSELADSGATANDETTDWFELKRTGPWGNALQSRVVSDGNTVTVMARCAGPDGEHDTDDDIIRDKVGFRRDENRGSVPPAE